MELKNTKARQQAVIIFSISAVLLLALLFALGFLRRWKKSQQQNRIISHQKLVIEEKQKAIIDSINYARRIQNSLLPNEKSIKKIFNRM